MSSGKLRRAHHERLGFAEAPRVLLKITRAAQVFQQPSSLSSQRRVASAAVDNWSLFLRNLINSSKKARTMTDKTVEFIVLDEQTLCVDKNVSRSESVKLLHTA